jgi:hypothetical protein
VKLSTAIDKKCSMAFATLGMGDAANLDALAADCAAHGVEPLDTLPAYEECLFRQHTCRSEELLRFEFPRAQALIAARGLPPQQSGFCPAPTPSPTATP